MSMPFESDVAAYDHGQPNRVLYDRRHVASLIDTALIPVSLYNQRELFIQCWSSCRFRRYSSSFQTSSSPRLYLPPQSTSPGHAIMAMQYVIQHILLSTTLTHVPEHTRPAPQLPRRAKLRNRAIVVPRFYQSQPPCLAGAQSQSLCNPQSRRGCYAG